MAKLEELFEPGMAIHLRGSKQVCYESPRVGARRSIHLRFDSMTGQYSLGPQPGRAQRLNIGGDGAKPRVAVVKTVVDGANVWRTVSLVPEADGVPLTFDDVFNALHLCAESPYQVTTEARLVGLQGPEGVEAAKDILRQYDTMRADLRFFPRIRLDLGAFGNTTQFGLELFRLRSRTIPVAPPLTELEEEWLCLRGGVIYTASKDGVPWTGEGVQLDFTSFYPSVQLSKSQLPNCEPVVYTLPAHIAPGTYPKFGLYRALIIVEGPGAKLWKYAPRVAVFTSTDLQTARLLGGTVTLADDGQPNALLYEKAKVQCGEAFGGFINDLYPLKVAKMPVGKIAINKLWASLGQKNLQRVALRPGDEAAAAKLESLGKIVAFHVEGTTEHYTCLPPPGESRFKGPYPRWASFVTAAARQKLVKTLLPVIDRVVRCHTDRFLLEGLDVPPSIQKLVGPDIGQLHIEHRGKCTFTGMRKPVWD